MKTNKEVLKELEIIPTYDELGTSTEDVRFNMGILMTCIQNPNIKISDILQDDDMPFSMKILKKNIEAMSMEDRIPDIAIVYSLIFNLDTPAKAIIYLTELMDHLDKNSDPLTINDLSIRIFPNGFYDNDTCTKIIDNVMKPKKSKNSIIY